MPSNADFIQAAGMFRSAASEVYELMSNIESVGADQIVFGGSVGRDVPATIAAASGAAATCQGMLIDAAEICDKRAADMAVYEEALRQFVEEEARYRERWQAYDEKVDRANDDPNAMPTEPTEPYPQRPVKPQWGVSPNRF